MTAFSRIQQHFRKRVTRPADTTRALGERATATEGARHFAELDRSPVTRRAERHSREPLELAAGIALSPDAWRMDDDAG